MTSQWPIILLHCDTPVWSAIVYRHIAWSMLAIGICGRQRALILVGYWTIGFSSLTSSSSHFSLSFSSFFFLFLLSFYTRYHYFPLSPLLRSFFFLHLSLTRSFMDAKLIKPSSPDVHPHVGENFKGKKAEVMASRTYKSDAPYENYARYSELRLLKNEPPFDGIMNTLVWLGIDRSYLYSSARQQFHFMSASMYMLRETYFISIFFNVQNSSSSSQRRVNISWHFYRIVRDVSN